MEAIISASPRALVVPAGTGWGGPGRQELGEHWDGANTGAHMDVSAVPAPPRPELIFTESAVPKPWGIFSVGYKMLLVSRRLCMPSLFWESAQVLAGHTLSSAQWLSSVPT